MLIPWVKTLPASLYKPLIISGYKANLSPAKLKLADIGLEMSLAITYNKLYTCKRSMQADS